MQVYKKSKFVRVVPIKTEGRDFVAVYRPINKAFFILPESKWHSVLRDPQEDIGLFHLLLSDDILVPESLDENVVLWNWRQEIVHNFKSLKSLTITTRRCNLGCTYCFLDPEAKRMNRETALRVDKFYTDRIQEMKPDDVTDVYSGGEVMLNARIAAIESAARRSLFCKGSGIKSYKFWIITNGTLLNPAIIKQMKDVGLEGVRVSIAGPAWIHNKLRPFKGSGDTYDRIIRNLVAISGLTRIRIETQYDPFSDDYIHLPEMLDDMRAHGIDIENVSFTPIVPKRGGITCQCGLGDPKKLLYLKREAQKRGFPQFDQPPSNGCAIDRKNHFVFDVDGKILPCAAMQSGEMAYGHVDTGINFVAHSLLLERRFPSKCLQDCEILPLCQGGCRINNLSRGEDFNGVDCQYEILSLLLDEYIREKALAALSSENQNQMKAA